MNNQFKGFVVVYAMMMDDYEIYVAIANSDVEHLFGHVFVCAHRNEGMTFTSRTGRRSSDILDDLTLG